MAVISAKTLPETFNRLLEDAFYCGMSSGWCGGCQCIEPRHSAFHDRNEVFRGGIVEDLATVCLQVDRGCVGVEVDGPDVLCFVLADGSCSDPPGSVNADLL